MPKCFVLASLSFLISCHNVYFILSALKNKLGAWDFRGGTVDRNLPASAGDPGSIPIREDPTFRGATKPVSHNY